MQIIRDRFYELEIMTVHSFILKKTDTDQNNEYLNILKTITTKPGTGLIFKFVSNQNFIKFPIYL